jgi:hypothetical protein
MEFWKCRLDASTKFSYTNDRGQNRKSKISLFVCRVGSLPLGRRLLSTVKPDPGRHSGAKEEQMKFESRIVQGPSVEVSEFEHSLPLRECHQHLKTHPTIMKLSRICLFIVVLSGFSALRCEAAVYHSNGSVSNVQTLHDYYAHDGDTITLPAGRFSWTRRLAITKGITLQGQNTITGAGASNPQIVDATIILDNTPRTGSGGIISAATTPNRYFRLTGVTFRFGTVTRNSTGGAVTLSSIGNSAGKMRVDHCHFDKLYANTIMKIGGWLYGVADHNVITLRGKSFGFHVQHGKYGGSSQINGNGSWADYPWYGTDKFWFIETNTIKRANATFAHSLVDCDFGGRWVARHNYVQNAIPQGHGTEGAAFRGQRVNEFYDNTVNNTVLWNGGGQRAGTNMWHDNVFLGYEPSGLGALVNYRTTWVRTDPVWGISDGTSVWDRNDTQGTGTYVEGRPPFLFASGTDRSSVHSQGVMHDSTKNWATNRWRGYSIRNTNPAVNLGAYIISNTSNTITYWYSNVIAGNRKMIFNAGDTYEIHRVLTVMDGCGMGKGDQVSGAPQPINTTVSRPFWTHQATEPCYSWNNVYLPNGRVLGFRGSGIPLLPPRENIEYFNLGGGFPPNTTPLQVRSRYVAARNGVDCTGTFIYPHPLAR